MTRTDGAVASGIVVALFLAFNANGREIASFDTQPQKYAAAELLVRGTLSLNHVVGRAPGLAERAAFVPARDGRYRSAYSPVPPIAAAAVAWPFWKAGLLDVRAPRGPSALAALAASLLTALAVGAAYLTARPTLSISAAALLAISLGLGTGLWPTVSQSLWEHTTAVPGLAIAVYALTRPGGSSIRLALLAGTGLGIAGASREQLAPVVLVLLAAVFHRHGRRAGFLATAACAAFVAPVLVTNQRWFGSLLGATPILEALHAGVHSTTGTFRLSLDGFAGLLVSPSRGLLIFSPIIAVAAPGMLAALRAGKADVGWWCLLAAAAQFVLYASYVVWWGGHTYGPRYMLDILPLLVPLAPHGITRLAGPAGRTLAAAALAWSIATSATGAFCYPNDQWNTDPASVDRYHERLWEWHDNQIVRCWRRGMSPQNFNLFDPAARGVPGR